jgi:hypothetical protein
MTKHSNLTPSLFDEPELVAAVVEEEEDDPDWDEVPQAVFLSWSVARQLDYCWRRDLTSAVSSEPTPSAEFFLQRAAAYKQDLDVVKQ